MNAIDTLQTLREIRGLLHETEKHFLRERGWTCRVADTGAVVWGKVLNGHNVESSQPHALAIEERGIEGAEI